MASWIGNEGFVVGCHDTRAWKRGLRCGCDNGDPFHRRSGMNLYMVTGTTQGLGKALAERIALDPENELIALARAPEGPIAGGAAFEVDLADAAALERACDRIEARIAGRSYAKAVLVNNAGMIAP